MPFPIVRNDISLMSTDVIVSAANERLLAGGGVCGAIFKAAGPAKLAAACEAVAPCPTGRAVGTPAFGLDARRIVHAVGPRWIDGAHGEEARLPRKRRRAPGRHRRQTQGLAKKRRTPLMDAIHRTSMRGAPRCQEDRLTPGI